MEGTTLYIKNMVCDRCKAAVTQVLHNAGLTPLSVELGTASVEENPDVAKLDEIRIALEEQGFELLEDRRKQTVDRIKSAIIELVHYRDNHQQVNLSAFLSNELGMEYSSLSKLFSENTGLTIERYFILQRVERIKELIFYGEMSLSEIARKMNYSSVAYLSTQFKSVTGMTPSQFKSAHDKQLRQLDKI